MGNIIGGGHASRSTLRIKKVVKKQKQKQKQSLIETKLHSIGFCPSLLKAHASKINEKVLIENYSPSDAIKLLWRQWSALDRTSCKSALQSVGFKAAHVRSLVPILEPLWDHYTVETIIDIAIEFKLEKYKAYAPQIKRGYLFESIGFGQVNSNVHPTAMHFNGDGDGDDCMNLIKAKCMHHNLYFHATSWEGALSICKEGVVHESGRPCLDFGIKPGFYTTPSSLDALEWAQRKKKLFAGECAIILFSIPKKFPSDITCKRFEKANREWTKLTKESRACFLKYNELDKFDFVDGPMMADIPHNPIKHQLASKSAKSDALLNECLVGVVWLYKKI